MDEVLTRDDGAGARGLLGDALGSTLALVDGSGTIQATYTYDPFGATTVTGQPGANTLSYTGREDDGTGLKYYRARYYHPGPQRFISEDPIGLAGGDSNLYVYVTNDPLGFVDPLGLDKRERCEFSDRFWKNFWTINDPLVRRPLLLVGGFVVGGEFTRLTGVPGPLKWTLSGFPRLQGYVPIARTLGIVGAGATTYTFAQSAATVAAAGALRGGLVFSAFEIGVIFGSAVNAAAVQPLLEPYLGITGCEG